MNTNRVLLAMASLGSSDRAQIATIAAEAAFDIHFESEPQLATRWLEHHQAQAILLDAAVAASEQFAINRRAESSSAMIPILFLADTVTDLRFAEALAAGADDVVSRGGWDHLRSRLRHLPKEAMALAECTRGSVLIGESERARRVLSGRVLRNAGYSVSFAVNEEDLYRNAAEQNLSVIVANIALAAAPRDLVARCRASGNQTFVVFTCPPREIKRYNELLSGLNGVTLTDAFAPAENALFVANELSRPRGADQRASARILYGTTVAFRGAGRVADDYGYTYNLSEGGMYVRTLAPPEDSLVWLELTPPRCDRRVRLVGRVAWRRGIAQGQFATVPPGFGLEIVDGAQMDVMAWREGCRTFALALE